MTDEVVEIVPDWGSLPKDVLQCIFAQVLKATEDTPWAIFDAITQMQALRRVCKHFLEASKENPPVLHLIIGNCPSYILQKWIPSFPIESLKLYSYFDLERLQLGEPNEVLAAKVNVDCMVPVRLDPNSEPLPPSDLHICQLKSLRMLHLDCPEVWRDNTIFSAAPLSKLNKLTHVTAIGFKDFVLSGLPSSVTDLKLGYGEPYVQDILSSHSISIPVLPDDVSLERLTIKKNGIVGLDLENIWDSCRHVEIECMFVLAGVPVKDNDIITFFERPYREGRYVPPHILGDWDAVEASNRAADQTIDHLVTGLATCKRLETITFTGNCATSVKLVPGKTGALTKCVKFLHSVCMHATLFVYGASGAELLDRYLDMQGAGNIPAEALQIDIEDGRDAKFKVVVKNRVAELGGRLLNEDQGKELYGS